ncbi:hypothetical protein BDW75DRAFT_241930 [Aspergillus navahoensis]
MASKPVQQLLSDIGKRLLHTLEHQRSATDAMTHLSTDQIDGAFQTLVAMDHENSSVAWQVARGCDE